MYSQDFNTAQYLVSTFTPLYGGISPMKLQKLMYYLKVWGLVVGTPLVASAFQKWTYGPVEANLLDIRHMVKTICLSHTMKLA